MKCFVTGATGFIGGHLVEKLAGEGHEVIALLRPGAPARALEESGVTIVRGTLGWTNVFARHAGDADVVFHLAGLSRSHRSLDFEEVNHQGTLSLLRGLQRALFRGRIVYLSTLAAGGPSPDPTTPRTEDEADQPVSAYGISKKAAERAILENCPEGATWTILRTGKVYGPGARRVAAELARLRRTRLFLQFHPDQYLQITHVDDLVDGLLRAAFSPEASRREYHLVDPAVLSYARLMEACAEALGIRIRIINLPAFLGKWFATLSDGAARFLALPPFAPDRSRMADMQAGSWVADASRAGEELGWTPRRPLGDGLAESIGDFRRRGWLE